MAIPTEAQPTPIQALQLGQPLADKAGLASLTALRTLNQMRDYVVGAGRLIPCSAALALNVLTLTPNDAAPSIEGYIFGDCYPFWSDADSTGTVTATLVPKSGALATLKVYKDNGLTQAGAGDVLTDAMYVAYFAPHLDGGIGGIVLK